MLQIKVARIEDFVKVRTFYHQLIDAMEDMEYAPGWKKGIYPSDEYLRSSIKNGELYLGYCGKLLAAAMVVNHAYNEAYEKVKWSADLAPEEVSYLHSLGVRPSLMGQGVAKAMVAEVFQIAMANKQKAIRLDVLKGNVPAEKLYASMGFEYLETLSMYYEDTGWTDYMAYELLLEEPACEPAPIFPHEHMEVLAEAIVKNRKKSK